MHCILEGQAVYDLTCQLLQLQYVCQWDRHSSVLLASNKLIGSTDHLDTDVKWRAVRTHLSNSVSNGSTAVYRLKEKQGFRVTPSHFIPAFPSPPMPNGREMRVSYSGSNMDRKILHLGLKIKMPP